MITRRLLSVKIKICIEYVEKMIIRMCFQGNIRHWSRKKFALSIEKIEKMIIRKCFSRTHSSSDKAAKLSFIRPIIYILKN